MSPYIFALVFVCGAAVTHAQDHVECKNIYYNGPIEQIIKSEPSKLAFATTKVSEQAAQYALKFAKLTAFNAIKSIPVAGAILGNLFKTFTDNLGVKGDVVETVYNKLKAEIDQLRTYVDQRIEAVGLDIIRKSFGTSRGGILGYANHCQKTYQGDADDLMSCLENLRAMLVQQYHFFLPEKDDIASYEKTLPLFRMYGQLFVNTLLEQISVAEARGKPSQAAAHAEALKKRVAEFVKHAENAVMKIVQDQTFLRLLPKENNPACATADYVTVCTCTMAIGPNEFDVGKDGQPTDKTKNYCFGISVNTYGICSTTKNAYMRKYRLEHAKAILSYWRKQLGDTVDNWKKAAEEVGKLAYEHKRSLPLLERIEFMRDVERNIAKENQMIMMGKRME